MSRDIFDVYQSIMVDTSQISSKRQSLDTVYTTIVTLILGADAYVAGNSKFDNWFAVLVTVALGLVGWAFTWHWRRVLNDLKKILDLRYTYLREMEDNPKMHAIHAQIYTKEYNAIYAHPNKSRFGIGARIKHLQTIFLIIFTLIPFFSHSVNINAFFLMVPFVHSSISVIYAR